MTTRDTTLSLVALGLVAVLALSYGTPAGRRLARQAQRGARVIYNVSGDALPAVVLRFWGDAPASALEVKVYESGRIVVSRPGRAHAVRDRAAAEKIIAASQLALGDFNASGCDSSPGGMNGDLFTLVRGERRGSVCRHALDWPRGRWTRQLLRDVAEHLPPDAMLPVKF
jgi:hypothetical protein